jgi:hypothetical protein
LDADQFGSAPLACCQSFILLKLVTKRVSLPYVLADRAGDAVEGRRAGFNPIAAGEERGFPEFPDNSQVENNS